MDGRHSTININVVHVYGICHFFVLLIYCYVYYTDTLAHPSVYVLFEVIEARINVTAPFFSSISGYISYRPRDVKTRFIEEISCKNFKAYIFHLSNLN